MNKHGIYSSGQFISDGYDSFYTSSPFQSKSEIGVPDLPNDIHSHEILLQRLREGTLRDRLTFRVFYVSYKGLFRYIHAKKEGILHIEDFFKVLESELPSAFYFPYICTGLKFLPKLYSDLKSKKQTSLRIYMVQVISAFSYFSAYIFSISKIHKVFCQNCR